MPEPAVSIKRSVWPLRTAKNTRCSAAEFVKDVFDFYKISFPTSAPGVMQIAVDEVSSFETFLRVRPKMIYHVSMAYALAVQPLAHENFGLP